MMNDNEAKSTIRANIDKMSEQQVRGALLSWMVAEQGMLTTIANLQDDCRNKDIKLIEDKKKYKRIIKAILKEI